MPTSDQALYYNVMGRVSTAAPVCETDYLFVLNDGMVYKSWRVPERRVKPVPLFKSPTHQGKASTYMARYPIEQLTTPQVCGGQMRYYTTYSAPQIYTSIPSPYLPWQDILAQKVKDVRVNLASDMAEYREGLNAASTVGEDLAKYVKQAKQLVKDIRRGRVPRGGIRAILGPRKVRRWQDVPASWLGIQLALAPALGNLAEIVDSMSNPAHSRPLVRRVRFSSAERIQAPVMDQWGISTNAVVDFDVRQNVTAYIELQSKSLWQDNFTPGNPLEWAWEAITLSFVIDWFIPVGNFLSSLDAYSGTSGVWGTRSVRIAGVARNVKRSGVVTIRPGSILYRSHERTAFFQPPYLPYPKWNPSPSWTKLVTAMSLLTANTRR